MVRTLACSGRHPLHQQGQPGRSPPHEYSTFLTAMPRSAKYLAAVGGGTGGEHLVSRRGLAGAWRGHARSGATVLRPSSACCDAHASRARAAAPHHGALASGVHQLRRHNGAGQVLWPLHGGSLGHRQHPAGGVGGGLAVAQLAHLENGTEGGEGSHRLAYITAQICTSRVAGCDGGVCLVARRPLATGSRERRRLPMLLHAPPPPRLLRSPPPNRAYRCRSPARHPPRIDCTQRSGDRDGREGKTSTGCRFGTLGSPACRPGRHNAAVHRPLPAPPCTHQPDSLAAEQHHLQLLVVYGGEIATLGNLHLEACANVGRPGETTSR